VRWRLRSSLTHLPMCSLRCSDAAFASTALRAPRQLNGSGSTCGRRRTSRAAPRQFSGSWRPSPRDSGKPVTRIVWRWKRLERGPGNARAGLSAGGRADHEADDEQDDEDAHDERECSEVPWLSGLHEGLPQAACGRFPADLSPVWTHRRRKVLQRTTIARSPDQLGIDRAMPPGCCRRTGRRPVRQGRQRAGRLPGSLALADASLFGLPAVV